MKRLHFSVIIDAPREKVWQTLWEDATYREWTRPFCEGSYVISDWNEGSSVQFLAPNGSGMASIIEHKIPNEFMSFKHLAMIHEGKEVPNDEKALEWVGALENYKLIDHNGSTEVKIDVDLGDTEVEYMNEKWPIALYKLKQISENNFV